MSIIIVILISVPIIFLIIRARMKFVTVKITHWLLFIYIGLLLLSMAVVPFLGDKKVKEVDIKQRTNIYLNLSNGEKIDSKYIVQKENFNFEGSELTIQTNKESDRTIFIERKNSDDKNIEAFVYSEGFIINDYNFTDQLVPIHLDITGDSFTINYPVRVDINLSFVKSEFTINQFKSKPILNGANFIDHGEQYIYLRIPKNLKLIKEPSNLIYVGE